MTMMMIVAGDFAGDCVKARRWSPPTRSSRGTRPVAASRGSSPARRGRTTRWLAIWRIRPSPRSFRPPRPTTARVSNSSSLLLFFFFLICRVLTAETLRGAGRAFPDISFAGHGYQVAYGGRSATETPQVRLYVVSRHALLVSSTSVFLSLSLSLWCCVHCTQWYNFDGTSCSTTALAGLITLANQMRLDAYAPPRASARA